MRSASVALVMIPLRNTCCLQQAAPALAATSKQQQHRAPWAGKCLTGVGWLFKYYFVMERWMGWRGYVHTRLPIIAAACRQVCGVTETAGFNALTGCYSKAVLNRYAAGWQHVHVSAAVE
jgi:hypothetical protein